MNKIRIMNNSTIFLNYNCLNRIVLVCNDTLINYNRSEAYQHIQSFTIKRLMKLRG